jgi:UDP-2-acetamido-3-amino-2,3-dideoxy-glucuronate N-acetyltransferase
MHNWRKLQHWAKCCYFSEGRPGNNVKIQNNVSVYTGVVAEDDVFIGPSCVFTNVINPRSAVCRKSEYKSTLLRKGCSLGANSTIICNRTIGKYALVGAGSVVSKDVPDYAVVVGNPAKVIGYVCSCGGKLNFKNQTANCPLCQKKYVLIDEKVMEK